MSENFFSIIKGNSRFRSSNTDFRNLAVSQNPEYILIACSDSRVAPSIILDAPLGSIFEVRIAGEVMDESSLATVEFAVSALGIRKIVVMGHTNCGAVTAAYEHVTGKTGLPAGNSALINMINSISEVLNRYPAKDLNLDYCIRKNTNFQALRILEINSVGSLFESGELSITNAIYDLKTGEIELFPIDPTPLA